MFNNILPKLKIGCSFGASGKNFIKNLEKVSIACGPIRRQMSKVVSTTDDKNGFRTIALNNPPVNTLSNEVLESVVDEVRKARDDTSVNGLLFKSHMGGRAFCAGLNIVELYQKNELHYYEYWKRVQEWYFAVYGCDKPTVAAINGHAPAGGCAFALMTDYRVMLDGFRIGLNEAQVGIAPTKAIAWLLVDNAGTRIGEYGVLSGKLFSSQEALSAGIVDSVVHNEDDLMTKAVEELTKLCSVPAPAFSMTKMLLRGSALSALKEEREKDAKDFANMINSKPMQDAIGSYLTNLKKKK